MEVFCDLKFKVQHLLLYSRQYRSQDVAFIKKSSGNETKMTTKHKNYKTAF